MPSLGRRFAQRFRYPNGTSSDPFIASLDLKTMRVFSYDILGRRWPLAPLAVNLDGSVDADDLRRRGDSDVGSCRIDVVFDGRFWSTLEQWADRVAEPVSPEPRRDGTLTRAQLLVLFPQAREAEPWSLVVQDPYAAVALTVLKWAKSVEEWT